MASAPIIPLADLADMQNWARALMASRPADFVIGNDYLRRWWVIPRNPWMNVYLHDIRKSDDDRAFHDHPWENASFVIEGGYIEHAPEGTFHRRAGDYVMRRAEQLHRLEVMPGMSAISLFITGPKLREWGFACPQGWVHYLDFTNENDPSQIGRGCGEPFAPTPVTPIGQARLATIPSTPPASISPDVADGAAGPIPPGGAHVPSGLLDLADALADQGRPE